MNPEEKILPYSPEGSCKSEGFFFTEMQKFKSGVYHETQPGKHVEQE